MPTVTRSTPGVKKRPPCWHCGERNRSRPAGLCFRCFYIPGLPEQYRTESKFCDRGHGLGNRNAPLPDLPTDALPGSPEKLAILEQRAQLGQSLWHPRDRRITETDIVPRVEPAKFSGRDRSGAVQAARERRRRERIRINRERERMERLLAEVLDDTPQTVKQIAAALGVGNYLSVQQKLKRLAKQGRLVRRIGRKLYAKAS